MTCCQVPNGFRNHTALRATVGVTTFGNLEDVRQPAGATRHVWASAPDVPRHPMFLVTARACGPIGRCPHPDRRNDTLMVFKRMLAAFGVGGPSVDTVLDASHAMPGQVITGQVRIQGGGADADIDRIELSLVTRADAHSRGGQARGAAEFLRLRVAERLRVPANQL